MSQNEVDLRQAALVPGDVVDAMRCIVDAGVSIREFEYSIPRGSRATIVIARSAAAAAVIAALLLEGRAAAVAQLPPPEQRRSLLG